MQMFVPQSRIRIFRNERTRSSPLDPKLPSFGCLTKLGAKQAELMQKFIPRSCVGIFCNERTRSTPLDPKLPSFFALRNSVQNGPNLVQKFMPRSRVGIFCNKCTRSTPLEPKLTFCCISYYLGAFGILWLPYETRCTTAELVQKYVPRSCIGIFRNERTRSTPLDPKLTFWCVSYYLGAFGTPPLVALRNSVQNGPI